MDNSKYSKRIYDLTIDGKLQWKFNSYAGCIFSYESNFKEFDLIISISTRFASIPIKNNDSNPKLLIRNNEGDFEIEDDWTHSLYYLLDSIKRKDDIKLYKIKQSKFEKSLEKLLCV